MPSLTFWDFSLRIDTPTDVHFIEALDPESYLETHSGSLWLRQNGVATLKAGEFRFTRLAMNRAQDEGESPQAVLSATPEGRHFLPFYEEFEFIKAVSQVMEEPVHSCNSLMIEFININPEFDGCNLEVATLHYLLGHYMGANEVAFLRLPGPTEESPRPSLYEVKSQSPRLRPAGKTLHGEAMHPYAALGFESLPGHPEVLIYPSAYGLPPLASFEKALPITAAMPHAQAL